MKKIAILATALALSGCVQVDNYQHVVKVPAPQEMVGYWQSSGPQSKLVSPEAIASLVVTADGDTLDCRQWQRVIAVPGKLMRRDDYLYNVTSKLEIYDIALDTASLNYAGMTFHKVNRLTPECTDYLAKHPLPASIK
ncbi:lipoprotein [Shimwellia pseudoproteus]|uniref:lipoprotein YedD n=1 Tax=Shimwellia pseudoproteus TaxID=570012 RepID=UPI0018EDD66C|nr:lipoprotein YedD [Shimwellia pseudoproteus]MBJ3814741.1 lipoprotein [Shimwellia pseudoproteus]